MADLPPGFYRTELNRTVWEVPEKYQDLSPIGTGAYGQVWWVQSVKMQTGVCLDCT